MGEQMPQVIGEYKIMRPVARGVMGMVYVATTGPNVFHAIKVLDPKVAEKLPWAIRFVEDIKDKYILDYKAIDVDPQNRTYFVTEYYEVKPIARARLPEYSTADVVELFATLAGTLQKIHDAGLAHGNLKSSNIMARSVEGPTSVWIYDFGIQYVYDPALFAGEKFRKTFPYMSPERIRQYMEGAAAAETMPTAGMDIYSLGVTLCEVLTGDLAFSDVETPEALLEKKKKRHYMVVGPNRPVRRLDLETLNQVVKKATAFEPEARHKSMNELAGDLRSCIAPQ
jgi:serine/threonine protein kinase